MKPDANRWFLPLHMLCAGAFALALALPARAQQAAPAAKKPPVASASQAQAREILMRMAAYIASAEKYSVHLRAGYDAVQKSGEKIEFNEARIITLSRPDKLRVEGVRSDGARTLVVFAGKEITLFDAAHEVYATTPQPGTIDQSIVHFVSDLGMRLPLSLLLMTRMPAELEARVTSLDYVERTNILGAPTHHLAARTKDIDFQVWVTDGDKPVPLRVVLTYKTVPGHPQFRAQLSEWNFAPAIKDATFAAQIPAGAQKVAFAAQLQRATMAARKGAPAKKGAKQ
jgi:hypothetical protein